MKQIEKGIPIQKNRPGPKRKYPFLEMEIGESFVSDTSGINASVVAGHGTERYSPRRFTGRKIADGPDAGKYRVWRIE